MDVVRYGLVLPILLLAAIGLLTKHALWVPLLIAAGVILILFVLGCSFWGFRQDVRQMRKQQRKQLDDAGRDAASRLSPPQ